MRTHERLDAETMAWSLATLLGVLPDAVVGALDDHGAFTEMPSSVPLLGHGVVDEGCLADLVLRDDAEVVSRTWEEVQQTGLAQGNVRFNDGRTAIVHEFDVHEVHGVVVAVVEFLTGGAFGPAGAVGSPPLRPTVCQVRHNVVGTVTEVDDAATAMLGWSREDLVGRRPNELVHPDDFDESVAAWVRLLQSPGGSERSRMRHRCGDGTWLWVEVTHTNLLGDRRHPDVVSELVDVSREVAAVEALAERDALLRHLTGSTPWGTLQLDGAGGVRFANGRLLELLGIAAEPTAAADVWVHVATADRPSLDDALDRALRHGARAEVEVRVVAPERGPARVCSVVAQPLPDLAGLIMGAVVSVSDLVDDCRR